MHYGRKSKFGSTDNIAALNELNETRGETRTLGTGEIQPSLMYDSDDDCCGSAGGPGSSREDTADLSQASSFDTIYHEIPEMRENQRELQECFENMRAFYQQDHAVVMEALQEEQCRGDLLEEQLTDLTELYRNEISNLKEELASVEDKIAHQSDKRATDFHEALEVCQTHLLKLEMQQYQQQVVQQEYLENPPAQILGKLINVLLAVMAVLLVVFSTVAHCILPLMRTPGRMLSTLLSIVVLSVIWSKFFAVILKREENQ
ncbi:transmembrane and coiled-coil domains protein 1-like [Embiotoca jacksoni]|uniref:transmembrane and coiled-coil domains protein 1-like n=1 Tax=Embiotoca jacksoni TaxID=100190 RepID=UPI0037049C6B